MKILVWVAVFFLGMGLGGWLSKDIGNLPIEHESLGGATRQSLLGLVIISASAFAAFAVGRLVF